MKKAAIATIAAVLIVTGIAVVLLLVVRGDGGGGGGVGGGSSSSSSSSSSRGAAPAAKAEWAEGVWGNCSRSCGGGTQKLGVVCKENNVVVPESKCPADKKPDEKSRPCNVQACEQPPTDQPDQYFWREGKWGNCSKPCGGGTQTRTIDCFERTTTTDSSGSTRTVDKRVAPDLSGCTRAGRPDDSRDCNTFACDTKTYEYGNWGPCERPTTCPLQPTSTQVTRVSKQYRDKYECKTTANGTKTCSPISKESRDCQYACPVDANACDADKVRRSRYVTPLPPSSYACPPLACGQRFDVKVQADKCVLDDGVTPSACCSGTKPVVTVKQCFGSDCAPPFAYSVKENWPETCDTYLRRLGKTACGQSENQYREVKCINTATLAEVPVSNCWGLPELSMTARPKRVCSTAPCPPQTPEAASYEWRCDPWPHECGKDDPCGVPVTQTRNVYCLKTINGVTSVVDRTDPNCSMKNMPKTCFANRDCLGKQGCVEKNLKYTRMSDGTCRCHELIGGTWQPLATNWKCKNYPARLADGDCLPPALQ